MCEASRAKMRLHRQRSIGAQRGETFRRTVLALVRERYPDFGPTLATEKLAERHGLKIGVETLRQWMMAEGLWIDRRHRLPSPHQPRRRRECLGEMVQIDGSEHAWFEDRAPTCTLLAFVDDATSRLMHLRFVASESARIETVSNLGASQPLARAADRAERREGGWVRAAMAFRLCSPPRFETVSSVKSGRFVRSGHYGAEAALRLSVMWKARRARRVRRRSEALCGPTLYVMFLPVLQVSLTAEYDPDASAAEADS
jgi:hypothetical protein